MPARLVAAETRPDSRIQSCGLTGVLVTSRSCAETPAKRSACSIARSICAEPMISTPILPASWLCWVARKPASGRSTKGSRLWSKPLPWTLPPNRKSLGH